MNSARGNVVPDNRSHSALRNVQQCHWLCTPYTPSNVTRPLIDAKNIEFRTAWISRFSRPMLVVTVSLSLSLSRLSHPVRLSHVPNFQWEIRILDNNFGRYSRLRRTSREINPFVFSSLSLSLLSHQFFTACFSFPLWHDRENNVAKERGTMRYLRYSIRYYRARENCEGRGG